MKPFWNVDGDLDEVGDVSRVEVCELADVTHALLARRRQLADLVAARRERLGHRVRVQGIRVHVGQPARLLRHVVTVLGGPGAVA